MTRLRGATLALALLLTLGAVPTGPARAQPACSQPGASTPVLLVHGLGRTEADFDLPAGSIRRTVQGIPGTIVDTFDYRDVNRKWVTDAGIGQALGERIACLGDASAAGGGTGRVVVVAHSMGGLATRHAASLQARGRPVSERLGLVVTLGTPHEGSWLEQALTLGTSDGVSAALLKVLTAGLRVACTAGAPTLDALFGVCETLQDPTSEAALAMRPGSQELKDLPGIAGLPVLAVGGQVRWLPTSSVGRSGPSPTSATSWYVRRRRCGLTTSPSRVADGSCGSAT